METKNPDATEHALRNVLPRKYWIRINEILVRHGQNICKPLSPICSQCVANQACERRGVARSR